MLLWYGLESGANPAYTSICPRELIRVDGAHGKVPLGRLSTNRKSPTAEEAIGAAATTMGNATATLPAVR